MLRISIPTGQTLDGIQGPFVFTADRYTLDGTEQRSGEWLITAAGPQRMSDWTSEETTIVTPLAATMVIVCLVNWLRRCLLWAILLSPLAAGAVTYQIDAKTGIAVTWPSSLSGSSIKGWKIKISTGEVFEGVTPTVTGYASGKPAMVSVPRMSESWDWYYVITNGGTGDYTTRTKLKWMNPYAIGSEPATNPTGNYDASGNPTLEDGTPITDPSNPVPPTDIPSSANGIYKNPFGSPATPVLTIRPKDGSPPTNVKGPTLNPGQQLPWDIKYPDEFDWEIGWDLGDGVVVYPGGSGNTGTSAPLPGGSPTPSPGGDGSTGAITTPPLPTPDAAPTGDVAAAVNRHAALTQAYGEAARTAAGITNNNLDSLESLFGKAIDKLTSIDGKTGTGTGPGEVSIEGEALDRLISIDEGINGPGVTPPKVEPPEANVADWSSKAKTQAIQRIRDAMSSIGNSMQFAKQGLGLGANYGSAPMAGSFQVLGRVYQFNLEYHSATFDLFRRLILGIAAIFFVWRALKMIGGIFA